MSAKSYTAKQSLCMWIYTYMRTSHYVCACVSSSNALLKSQSQHISMEIANTVATVVTNTSTTIATASDILTILFEHHTIRIIYLNVWIIIVVISSFIPYQQVFHKSKLLQWKPTNANISQQNEEKKNVLHISQCVRQPNILSS